MSTPGGSWPHPNPGCAYLLVPFSCQRKQKEQRTNALLTFATIGVDGGGQWTQNQSTIVQFNLSEWFGATNTEGGMNPPDQSSGSTEEWSHSR